jgi:hypothetical protein
MTSTITTRTSRARLPRLDVFTSLLGLGPIPFRHLAKAPRMFEERLSTTADPRSPEQTPLETSLRDKTVAKADRYLTRATEKTIEPLVKEARTTAARRDSLRDELARIPEQACTTRRGESISLDEASERANALSTTILEDEARGSVRHHQHSAARKRLTWLFVGADLLLLLYFMTNVFNVSLLRPWLTPIELGTAVVSALFVTFGIASFLHFFGRQHRVYTNDKGGISIPPGDYKGWISVGFVLVLMLVPAGMVGTRVFRDVLDNSGEVAFASFVAVALGLVMYGINWMIYRTVATDGSEEVLDLQHLSKQINYARLKAEALSLAEARAQRQIELSVEKARAEAAKLQQRANDLVARGPAVRTILYIRGVAAPTVEGAAVPEIKVSDAHHTELLEQIDRASLPAAPDSHGEATTLEARMAGRRPAGLEAAPVA